MKDLSNHDEENDPNLIATTLEDSINASHLDSLSQTNLDMMDVSQLEEVPPSKKETAREKRARKNITGRPRRQLPRIPRVRSSSISSNGDSDGPGAGGTQKKSDEGPSHLDGRSRHSKDASTKRHRSSSPIHPKKLGSMENPIDIDGIASLFEPIMIREYVWNLFIHSAHAKYMLQIKKETISLSLETNPPIIKGGKPYTVFDVKGKPESFTPSFHVSH
jgi:hypothetical protein